MDLLDLHVHRLQKKQPAGPTAKQSNSKLDGCTAAFLDLDFDQQKKRALAPAEEPGVWLATKGAKWG